MKNLQELLNTAWNASDELVLEPGRHKFDEPLTGRCSVRGIGKCWLDWKGGQTDVPMLTLLGTSGSGYSPNLSNLGFDGKDKAPGLLVDDVHNATISDIHFYRPRKLAMEVRKGWFLHLRNLKAGGGRDSRAFRFDMLNAGSVNGLHVSRMRGDGPMLTVWAGGASIHQVDIEECDVGTSPMVLLDRFKVSELSGMRTERLQCSTVIEVRDTRGALIRGITSGQKPHPDAAKTDCVVVLAGCRSVEVKQIDCANILDAVVRVMPDCVNCHVPRDMIFTRSDEPWAKQPRHIVDWVGRENNQEGDSR